MDSHTTEEATHSYSDVVASWPSSPISAIGEEAPSGDAETLAYSARVEQTLLNKAEVVRSNNTKNIVTSSKNHENDTSSLSGLSDLDDSQNLWTTVAHRHSRSLDSLKKNKKTVKKVEIVQNPVNNLATEQDTVVMEAVKQLTSTQKEQISRCYEKAQRKMIPRNWSES